MIARIYDADDNYVKTVEGSAETIQMNVPPFGYYEVVLQYEPPPEPASEPDPQLDLFD